VRKQANFQEIINNKIVPIEGDIAKDKLAMKDEDRELLVRELNVVINLAASIDFNERICDAI
jgi:fatty acyl-CoA reductase